MPNLREYPFQISYGPRDNRLEHFYIPALSRCVRYDRTTGFFTSSALAVAAAGVAQLIQNGGRMRLCVGAKLDERDVEAIKRGHDLSELVGQRLVDVFGNPEEALLKARLEVLAWMVADGTLEIKVVLPTDDHGFPQPAEGSREYFHAKEGLFTDAEGDQVAFSGSVNESETAWVHNYEQFAVYNSWDASRPYLAQVAQRFERLWEGTEPDWIAIPIPEAARTQLLSYRPPYAPGDDPVARWIKERQSKGQGYQVKPPVTPQPDQPEPVEVQRRLLVQFVRDAPYLIEAGQLGAATSAVEPTPHQRRVVDTIISRFPERFLIADEVGLGKTIEAGLAIRQLLISGRVQRCLIMTPYSVMRQWQEELYEKLALEVPRYDGDRFWGVYDRELPRRDGNPFDAYPVLLASSQLVKRQDRQDVLLEAQPWDLVVADEAHHARRRDFIDQRFRPNRLLELLLKLRERTQGLILLTATPMQVHPVEVYDLLRLLGMGGRWGASERHFLGFFSALRAASVDYEDANWDLVFDMVRDYFATGGYEDEAFARVARERLGLVEWEQIKALPTSLKRSQLLRQLTPEGRAAALEYANRHTPLRRYIFRNTRELLRDYYRRGIIKDRVPKREPRPEWIEMQEAERQLYDRIEEYIAEFYARYEQERAGLGFIMTVYRRRLTSSFAAIQRSLERRLAFLRGLANTLGLSTDDIEEDELSADVEIDEERRQDQRHLHKAEIAYVEDFLQELDRLSSDSKLEQLQRDLQDIFARRNTVVVFTQYTDTMDYLRNCLAPVYGGQVACYSGRGGEVWRDSKWVTMPKEIIKNAFRQGDEIKILLCTEAASEGLNLQTCGVLINYDMPWNPMRVEQRIGRIDRIGQSYDAVWVRNYFYSDTIEATVYQRLSDRIGWFEAVVGQLQPILAQVGRSIQNLAMLSGRERQQAIDKALDELRKAIDERQHNPFSLDEDADVLPGALPAPLTLADLEQVLTTAPGLQERFVAHRAIPGAYELSWRDQVIFVTFNAQVYDAHSSQVVLLTYGNPLFNELIAEVEAPLVADDGAGVLRLVVDENVPTRIYYPKADVPRALNSLSELQNLKLERPWTEMQREAAVAEFVAQREAVLLRLHSLIEARREAERLALVAQARDTLLRAALIEIILGQQADMFDANLPTGFSEQAVIGLKRHKFPFAGLLRQIDARDLLPSSTDPFYQEMQSRSRSYLYRQFVQLKGQAEDILNQLIARKDAEAVPQASDDNAHLEQTMLRTGTSTAVG